MNVALDPVVLMLPSAFFMLLFGIAATHKLLSWEVFRQQVADYRVLPRGWSHPVAVLLPAAEILLAVGWVNATTRPWAAGLSALALATYAGAMAWNLAQGRDLIDCGCGGTDGTQVIRPALVVRNLGLAALALLLAAAAGADTAPARAIGWVDWLTVFGGALALTGMYTTLNQILANLPPQRVLE